jgi:hypothetical protein
MQNFTSQARKPVSSDHSCALRELARNYMPDLSLPQEGRRRKIGAAVQCGVEMLKIHD